MDAKDRYNKLNEEFEKFSKDGCKCLKTQISENQICNYCKIEMGLKAIDVIALKVLLDIGVKLE